jgi:hypothetical protein
MIAIRVIVWKGNSKTCLLHLSSYVLFRLIRIIIKRFRLRGIEVQVFIICLRRGQLDERTANMSSYNPLHGSRSGPVATSHFPTPSPMADLQPLVRTQPSTNVVFMKGAQESLERKIKPMALHGCDPAELNGCTM